MLAVLLVAGLSVPLQAAAPRFADPGPLTSDTGHVLVEWKAPGKVTLEMAREAGQSDVRTLYSGRNTAFFLSGLANGDYRLQLRAEDGSLSAPLQLAVRHHSLSRALWLALVGAIVTLAVVFVIFRGARDE